MTENASRCKKLCERVHSKCGHCCLKKCSEKCGACIAKVEKRRTDCGHLVMVECSVTTISGLCAQRCEQKLKCGHQCKAKCSEDCTSVCDEEVIKRRSCGHLVKVPCSRSNGIHRTACTQSCGALLLCNHRCPAACGQCFQGRVHADCVETCGKPLSGCGHACPLPCGTVCLPCKQKCCSQGPNSEDPDAFLRRIKIEFSLKLLTHDAEAEKSFASAAVVTEMKKDLNANRAFTVKNQIKLTRVTEMIKRLLETEGIKSMKDEVERLYAVLLKPVSTMSIQRCRELTEEATRLAYMAVLRFSKLLLPFTSKTIADIDDFCSDVTESKSSFSPSKAKELVRLCQRISPELEEKVSALIDLSILDAPADQDLYEIVKKPAKSDRPAGSISASSVTPVPRHSHRSDSKGAVPSEARVDSPTTTDAHGPNGRHLFYPTKKVIVTAATTAATTEDSSQSSLTSRNTNTLTTQGSSRSSLSSRNTTAGSTNESSRLSLSSRNTTAGSINESSRLSLSARNTTAGSTNESSRLSLSSGNTIPGSTNDSSRLLLYSQNTTAATSQDSSRSSLSSRKNTEEVTQETSRPFLSFRNPTAETTQDRSRSQRAFQITTAETTKDSSRSRLSSGNTIAGSTEFSRRLLLSSRNTIAEPTQNSSQSELSSGNTAAEVPITVANLRSRFETLLQKLPDK